MGSSLAVLGLKLGRTRADLAPTWAQPAPNLGHLAPTWAQLQPNLGPTCAQFVCAIYTIQTTGCWQIFVAHHWVPRGPFDLWLCGLLHCMKGGTSPRRWDIWSKVCLYVMTRMYFRVRRNIHIYMCIHAYVVETVSCAWFRFCGFEKRRLSCEGASD